MKVSSPAPGSLAELAHGLGIQREVIRALVLRETRTRFGANQLGYLWALIEPCLWVATFYALYALAARSAPSGMHIAGFIVTGLVPYEMFKAVTTRCGDAIKANRALLYYPQVRPVDLILARGALEVATLGAVFLLLMTGAAMLGNQALPAQPLQVLLGLALAAGLGLGLGLLLNSAALFSNQVERIRGPMLRPLFWLSGVFYTAGSLPERAREALLFNPVLHAVELVRGGWFASYEANHASVEYPLSWVMALAFLGLSFERAARRRIEVT